MVIKTIIDEDFVNYKKPSMFIAFPTCTWKCERECGMRVCQNGALAPSPNINISTDMLCTRYLSNQITNAVVCGGLEPMDSFEDLYTFIFMLRYKYRCDDTVVIYTGYTEEECNKMGLIDKLIGFGNIIVKFGRFAPKQKKHYDDVLGVMLASNNQYGKVIS